MSFNRATNSYGGSELPMPTVTLSGYTYQGATIPTRDVNNYRYEIPNYMTLNSMINNPSRRQPLETIRGGFSGENPLYSVQFKNLLSSLKN